MSSWIGHDFYAPYRDLVPLLFPSAEPDCSQFEHRDLQLDLVGEQLAAETAIHA